MSEHVEVEKVAEQTGRSGHKTHGRRTLLGGIAIGVGVTVGGAVIAGAAGLFDPFIKSVVRGKGPYVQLGWDSAPIPERELQWQHFDRDPDAGPLPPSWKKVGLLATQSEALDEQRRMTGGQHAIAFRTSETAMQVGTLPEDQPFFTSKRGDGGRYVVGARIGNGDLDATLGLWLPDRQTFVAPAAGVTALGRVEIDALPQQWPGVAYV